MRLFRLARTLMMIVQAILANFPKRFVKDMLAFDASFYLAQYPDLQNSRAYAYAHYIGQGRKEGRIGHPPLLIFSGRFEDLIRGRESVLVVSHEASRTGAPVLSLNIVRELRKKYNVVTLLLHGGSIVDEFRDASAVLVGPLAGADKHRAAALAVEKIISRTRFSFAVVNTIESRGVLPALAQGFVPTVSLIHEFAAYTRPKDAFLQAALWSSRMVFSTPLTWEDASAVHPALRACDVSFAHQGQCKLLREIERSAGGEGEEGRKISSAVRPEGVPSDTLVVLGAGTVQLRKGVDLFIDCAARILQDAGEKQVRFVWVGNGYDPIEDLQYSVYLEDQIRRYGIQKNVSLLSETSDIQAAYKASDIVLISSRLDPLPNVAIDAMANALPIVCFDRTTGIADILKANDLGDACVAPYLNVEEMARKVLALLQSTALRHEIGDRLRQLFVREFDFEKYVTRLTEIASQCALDAAGRKADCAEIIASGLIRPDFNRRWHRAGEAPEPAVIAYVQSWANKIGRRKLFPGFHPGIFRSSLQGQNANRDPLAEYLRAGRPAGPWQYEVLTPDSSVGAIPSTTRIALHVHSYYPDLLQDIVRRLGMNRVRPDLLISVPDEDARKAAGRILNEYSGNIAEVRVVPNRGRDIGPFLTQFGERLVKEYDLVGHLHTKRTMDVRDQSVGRDWYVFLLENLVGGRGRMADVILGRLASDSSVGIVFPDDPNVIGWDENRPLAESLMGALRLNQLPAEFLFPVGTMFWARVESIRRIFDLRLGWDDYPVEPVPYDGSILHALERLFGIVASVGGGRCVLTNVPGVTR